MIVKCNHCGRRVEVGELARRCRDGLEIEYFVCNGCGAEYVAAVTDAALREDIRRFKAMMDAIRASKQDSGVSEAAIQEALNLMERNTRRCNELRKYLEDSAVE